MQHTQSLFGPAGMQFFKMAASLDAKGDPIKMTFGQNGHGGESVRDCVWLCVQRVLWVSVLLLSPGACGFSGSW